MNQIAEVEVMPPEGQAIAPVNTTPTTPMEMISHAVANGASVEVMEKLMGLHERWEANQARKAFDAAMAKLRTDMPEIIKKRTVDFEAKNGGRRTNYKYEDLSLVTEALSPVMAKCGLSFRWRTDTISEKGTVRVTCVIAHKSGHSEETTLSAGHDNSGNKNAIQAIGSTVTYLQRYTLKAAIGVAAGPDTDGEVPLDNTPISEDQLGVLRKTIDDVSADIAKFCRYYKIEKLGDLLAVKFDGALAMLETKRNAS